MLGELRRTAFLVASVVLILVLGVVAAWGHVTTASRVESVQRADRLRLQETLGGLTSQYLNLAFAETLRVAGSENWSLRPDDPGDRAALERAVNSSARAGYGATLVSLDRVPLTSYAPRGLPSPRDPGFEPVRAALLDGKPGLSDVVHVEDLALVTFAVPVKRSGKAVALLLAYADVRTWPLQSLDSTIRLGESAEVYVLDSGGTVAAARTTGLVATPFTDLPAGATAGGRGIVNVTRNGREQVLSYAPAGRGWTSVTIQDAKAFSGGLESRSRRDTLALVMLLTLVVLLLVWFNHSRQQALRRLADERLHDPLTGLAQRRLFAYRLEAARARHRRSGLPLAVLYCDLDGFKTVNDTYGHNAGDQLLAAVAERLVTATREDDLVVRLGGDEFVVVIEGADVEEIRQVVTRIRELVGQPMNLGGAVLTPSISVGAAVLRDPSRGDDLLSAADLAMYQVKRGATRESVVVLDRLVLPPVVVPAQVGSDAPHTAPEGARP